SSSIPSADIIVGGFPCQGFSIANKFRSKLDTSNQLYLEMLRIIRDKQPKWFIAENVKGLLSLETGEIFQIILNEFTEAGYRLHYQLVNMADHGVPQLRKRLIILGTRADLPEYMEARHPKASHTNKLQANLRPWPTAGQAMKEFATYQVD